MAERNEQHDTSSINDHHPMAYQLTNEPKTLDIDHKEDTHASHQTQTLIRQESEKDRQVNHDDDVPISAEQSHHHLPPTTKDTFNDTFHQVLPDDQDTPPCAARTVRFDDTVIVFQEERKMDANEERQWNQKLTSVAQSSWSNDSHASEKKNSSYCSFHNDYALDQASDDEPLPTAVRLMAFDHDSLTTMQTKQKNTGIENTCDLQTQNYDPFSSTSTDTTHESTDSMSQHPMEESINDTTTSNEETMVGWQSSVGNDAHRSAAVSSSHTSFSNNDIDISNMIHIPEATLVENPDVPNATIVEPEKCSVTIAGRKIKIYFIILVAVVILAIATMTTRILGQKTTNVEITPAPSLSPYPTSTPSISPAPSKSPISLHDDLIETISSAYQKYDMNSSLSSLLQDETSYQWKAMEWLYNDISPEWNNGVTKYKKNEILERYALASLFYAINGTGYFVDWCLGWRNMYQFLTNEHVCDWMNIPDTVGQNEIRCNQEKRVVHFVLVDNNLQGTLPEEFGFLTELTYLNLNDNGIVELPSSFKFMKKLSELHMKRTPLYDMPQFLQEIESLHVLDLSNSFLSGELIDLSKNRKLRTIDLSTNNLYGQVPPSYGDLSQLMELRLEDNDITGNVVFLCPLISRYIEYSFDCYGDEPKVICNCCTDCTFENETCTEDNETIAYLNIIAGEDIKNLYWSIDYYDDSNFIFHSRDEVYDVGENNTMQLCLPYPRNYRLYVSNEGRANATTKAFLTVGNNSFATDVWDEFLGSTEVKFSLDEIGLLAY